MCRFVYKRKVILRVFAALCLLVINVNILAFLSSSVDDVSTSDSFADQDEELLLLSSSAETLSALADHIADVNAQQLVLAPGNVTLNTTSLLGEDVVVVVQVHNRVKYLRQLVASLRVARGIERALLIFSHDIFSETINSVVREAAEFSRVLQIFYPHSLQLHPRSFPGQSALDCVRDVPAHIARQSGCENAAYPDTYGHYREAKYTQTKHHWWWKINRVFDQLRLTKNHDGLFVFLEEDHYVAPDFLHLLKLLESTRAASCSSCHLLSLGTYLNRVNFAADSAKVQVSEWLGWRHNMGMALTRASWSHVVRPCARHFCRHDDYNWDWSLQHVFLTRGLCLARPPRVMMLLAPRVFHVGQCGVHHKAANCDKSDAVAPIVARLRAAAAAGHLYPGQLTTTHDIPAAVKRRIKPAKANGGWADPRDQQLCESFSTYHADQITAE